MENTLGNFVKMKRVKLKLTQVQLAERSGVGLRFLRELEQGKETLQLNKINQVLVFFGHKLGPVKIMPEIPLELKND